MTVPIPEKPPEGSACGGPKTTRPAKAGRGASKPLRRTGKPEKRIAKPLAARPGTKTAKILSGFVQATNKPGLGVELNPDVVKTHLAPGETWWG